MCIRKLGPEKMLLVAIYYNSTESYNMFYLVLSEVLDLLRTYKSDIFIIQYEHLSLNIYRSILAKKVTL